MHLACANGHVQVRRRTCCALCLCSPRHPCPPNTTQCARTHDPYGTPASFRSGCAWCTAGGCITAAPRCLVPGCRSIRWTASGGGCVCCGDARPLLLAALLLGCVTHVLFVDGGHAALTNGHNAVVALLDCANEDRPLQVFVVVWVVHGSVLPSWFRSLSPPPCLMRTARMAPTTSSLQRPCGRPSGRARPTAPWTWSPPTHRCCKRCFCATLPRTTTCPAWRSC
jgi:hypothetical protein